MAKKIKDENGKTYVQKKPFYKRVWFWILVVIVVIAIFGGMGGNKTKSNTSSNSSSSAKSSASSSDSNSKSASTAGKITRTDYNNIKIGDLMQNGGDGVTYDSLVQKFGKPSSTTDSTTDGVTTKVITWTNVAGGGLGANMIITFVNDHAAGKNLSGFKLNRDDKISLSQFNGIQNGQTSEQVTKDVGEPDSLSETLVDGTTTVDTEYLTGVKGKLGANFSITYTNNVVSGKTQSNME